MTVRELRKALEGLKDWNKVYVQCGINIDITGTSEQTVSGFDDGTPMLALHIPRSVVKELGQAFSKNDKLHAPKNDRRNLK